MNEVYSAVDRDEANKTNKGVMNVMCIRTSYIDVKTNGNLKNKSTFEQEKTTHTFLSFLFCIILEVYHLVKRIDL